MENTEGLSPLTATKTTKTCLADFASIQDLYDDIAANLFFSPAASQATKGADGKDGQDGNDGKSAYQSWLDQGFEGSEADFIESLKANDGKSTYELWIEDGNSGSIDDFFASLKGDKGDPPSLEKKNTNNVTSGVQYSDIPGVVGLTILTLVYDDGSGDPGSMVPTNYPSISSQIQLSPGVIRCYFTEPVGDGFFKLCSSEFAK